MYINPLEIKVKHSDLEVSVLGNSSGLVLHLRHSSDPAVKALDATHRKENFAAKRDGKDVLEFTIDNMDSRIDDRVVAHVAGWHWKDGVDPGLASMQFSEKQLREFLKAVPFGDAIRESVLAHVERDANFFEMPAAS